MSILRIGLNCLEIEIASLQALYSSLGTAFEQAVDLMHQCKGRIVVTGVGKSAIIGQKIVATLNSTGSPSLFMHAADALHGDLGIIQSHDILLVLSKSGETQELKLLLPTIQSLRIPLLCITAQPESTLAKESRCVLHTPIATEADAHNLVPTTSTTAQLALGDALAMALMHLRGFTVQDFARVHPGGMLGKQLTLRVAELAARNQRPAVSPETPIREVIVEISRGRLGAVAVTNADQHVLGIITDGDIRRMLERNPNLSTRTAKTEMHPHPKSVQHDTLAIDALQIMELHSISQLIVLKEHTYHGMVHLHDLIKEGFI